MPCYRPLECWRQPGALRPGEKRIVFSKHDVAAKPLSVPCGQCIGCRLERSRRWAVRLIHESQLHDASSFLTLTYSDEYVPKNGSLNKEHFQNFMKRLRKGSSSRLRYFHCGEYGDLNGRPHYHCVLFGEDFSSDRVRIEDTQSGFPQWVSQRLCEVWGFGRCTVSDLTFETAAYTARYILKKLNVSKRSSDEHISRYITKYVDPLGGEFREPEYVTMSRRPGIGTGWFDKFRREAYPSDSVVMRGEEMLPPPFYDKLLEKVDPVMFERVKRERVSAAKHLKDHPDRSYDRLKVRELVKEKTIESTLKRSV